MTRMDNMEMSAYLLVYFAENFSGCFGVEEADNDSGVLSLQVGHSGCRVLEEALPGRNRDVG